MYRVTVERNNDDESDYKVAFKSEELSLATAKALQAVEVQESRFDLLLAEIVTWALDVFCEKPFDIWAGHGQEVDALVRAAWNLREAWSDFDSKLKK